MRKKNPVYKAALKIKIGVMCLVLLLNGCALIGTIIQLAPLAAIFVYYSAPSEVIDGEFACLKTIDYFKRGSEGQRAVKVKSEHYICLVDIRKGEVNEILQLPGGYEYDTDNISLRFEANKIYVKAQEINGVWEINPDDKSFKKISDEKNLFTAETYKNPNFALLPPPEIKEIKLP